MNDDTQKIQMNGQQPMPNTQMNAQQPVQPQSQPVQRPVMPQTQPMQPQSQLVQRPVMPQTQPMQPQSQPVQRPVMPQAQPMQPQSDPVQRSVMPQAQPMQPQSQPVQRPVMPQAQPMSNTQMNMQQPIQSERMSMQQLMQTTNPMNEQSNRQVIKNVDNSKKNKSKSSSSTGIIILLLIAIGFACYYFVNMNNPATVYRNLIKKNIGEIYDIVYQNDNKINNTVSLDANLDLEEGIIDDTILDLINKTTIALNYQMDKDNEQVVIKIDSDYDRESLIDLELFVDGKKNKGYLYAKDYFDKYLEVDIEDYSSYTEMLERNELNLGQIIRLKKAEVILKQELAGIVKNEDCSKEGDSYIFTITEEELINRLKIAIASLINNEKFLDCYEQPEVVKENLNSILESIYEISVTNQTIKFSVNKKMLSRKIENLTINVAEDEIVFDIKNTETQYKYISSQEVMLQGYIKVVERKNTIEAEFSIEIPELGTLVLNVNTTYITGKDIDKVDTSKIKKLDEITETEQNEIMTKIEESKLYELGLSMLFDIVGDANEMAAESSAYGFADAARLYYVEYEFEHIDDVGHTALTSATVEQIEVHGQKPTGCEGVTYNDGEVNFEGCVWGDYTFDCVDGIIFRVD